MSPPGFFSKILSMTFAEVSGVFCRSVGDHLPSAKLAKSQDYTCETGILLMFSTGRVMVGGPSPGAAAQKIVLWSAERDMTPSFFLNAACPLGLWSVDAMTRVGDN